MDVELGTPEEYTLYIVCCEGLPRIPSSWASSKSRSIYARFKSGNGRSQQCDLVLNNKDFPLVIPGLSGPTLQIDLFARHTAFWDVCIASLAVPLESLLSEKYHTVAFQPSHRGIGALSESSITFHVAQEPLTLDELWNCTKVFAVPGKWRRMVDCVKFLVKVGEVVGQLNPIAQVVVSMLDMGVNHIDERLKRLDSVHDLLDAIADASECISARDEQRYSSKRGLQMEARGVLLREIHRILVYLQPLSQASSVRRSSSKIEARVKEFRKRLSKLVQEYKSEGLVDTQVAVFTTLEQILGDKLPYARGVLAESSKRCLYGTRVALLTEIQHWALAEGRRACFLHGTAGRGKSAIAHTIALQLQEAGAIVPFFAFDRSNQERTAHQLFPTLTRQLSERSDIFCQWLCDFLPSQLESHDIEQQADRLFFNGLRECKIDTPLIFVIDALDECPHIGVAAAVARRTMLEKLADCLTRYELPHNVRIFITFRPEDDILQAFSYANLRAKTLSADDVKGTDRDIHMFVESKLAQTRVGNQVDAVAQAAQTLFECAAALCRALTRVNDPLIVTLPRDLERRIMKAPGQPLYETYRVILESHFDAANNAVMSIFRQLLSWIFVMQSPQPCATFHKLAEVYLSDANDIDFVLLGLGSLLTGAVPGSEIPIQPLHTSFRDFIFDTTESRLFAIDDNLEAAHAQVAYACLRILNDPVDGLRLNICRLPTSFVFKRDIKDLDQRVIAYISPALQYACHHGSSHLFSSGSQLSGVDILHELTLLFRRHFLYWLEACSCISCIDHDSRPAECLQQYKEWTEVSEARDLYSIIVDCIKFESYFREAISLSPPQVYISGLKFAPLKSRVRSLYHARFHVPVRISGSVELEDWQENKPTSIPLLGCRSNVAFSPDGNFIAAGTEEDCVRVWNAESGEEMAELLSAQGGSSLAASIKAVAFAPDGLSLASGSAGGIVRLWDLKAKKELCDAFTPGKNIIGSIAFSPDDGYIAIAADETIQLWDLMHRHQAGDTMRGHTDLVTSVAFSPDGTVIVSGSADRTVRLWDIQLLQQIGDAWNGHDSAICCVAFSPDGRTIASISTDTVLRLWDPVGARYCQIPDTSNAFGNGASAAAMIQLDSRPTAGTTRTNTKTPARGPRLRSRLVDLSVLTTARGLALSPDGSHVAVTQWTTSTVEISQIDLRPKSDENLLNLHAIECAVFSSDGRLIAMGCADGTALLWDASTLRQVGQNLTGHASKVVSVAFSPGNNLIATGSWDDTIRVWSTDTQLQVGDVRSLHTGAVTSVIFSPDGRCVISGSRDTTVRMSDAAQGWKQAQYFEHGGEVYSVAISPDGQRLASGGQDQTLRIWDVNTGQLVWNAPGASGIIGAVNSLAFSHDGRRIASGSNGPVHIWDTKTWAELGRCLHGNPVMSVAFSPDDAHVVFGSFASSVNMWSLDRKQEQVRSLHGHTGIVNSVAFSPSGTTFLSASSDTTIRLWDLASCLSGSLSQDGRVAPDVSIAAEQRLQSRICEKDSSPGWLFYDRTHPESSMNHAANRVIYPTDRPMPFLWVPPDIRLHHPRDSPRGPGVISPYPSFSVTLENETSIDDWCITYTPPSDAVAARGELKGKFAGVDGNRDEGWGDGEAEDDGESVLD